jgi:hypothetical protein
MNRKTDSRFSPDRSREVAGIMALGGRVRVGYPFWLRPLLRRGIVAITLGRTVYVSRALALGGGELLERTLRHELAHVRQVARLGTIRFLTAYLREYRELRRGGLGPHDAYHAIGFEREARLAERLPEESQPQV